MAALLAHASLEGMPLAQPALWAALLVAGCAGLSALLILVRDLAVVVVGVLLLVTRKVRIEVRFVGKVATFSLVVAIGLIAWGNLGYPFPSAAGAVGWVTRSKATSTPCPAGVSFHAWNARPASRPSATTASTPLPTSSASSQRLR